MAVRFVQPVVRYAHDESRRVNSILIQYFIMYIRYLAIKMRALLWLSRLIGTLRTWNGTLRILSWYATHRKRYATHLKLVRFAQRMVRFAQETLNYCIYWVLEILNPLTYKPFYYLTSLGEDNRTLCTLDIGGTLRAPPTRKVRHQPRVWSRHGQFLVVIYRCQTTLLSRHHHHDSSQWSQLRS